ncbi:MAG: hypothetical protein Q9M97_06955 [Candidatus Gracilibacteria bacterium]|nr:hypothetical protein [Candidatus Gracilibacteria bacterium]
MKKVIGNIYKIFEEFDKKDIDGFLTKCKLNNNIFSKSIQRVLFMK